MTAPGTGGGPASQTGDRAAARSPAGRGLRPGYGLAVAAVLLGLLAPLLGSDQRMPATGVPELTAELATGAPLIDAVDLAARIRAGEPTTLVDVRDSSAFIRFAIPTAERWPVGRLASLPEGGGPIVLYGDGDGTAARGWLLLRRLGHPDVRILERGVVGWIDGILEPVLPADSPEERARYRRVADLSRYFGGMPRVGEPALERQRSAESAVRLLSRRGCY